jgi:hypothetical protein
MANPFAFIGTTTYKGNWDANINSGSTTDGSENVGTSLLKNGGYNNPVGLTASNGDYWQCTVAGSSSIDGNSTWNLNDLAIYSGSVWFRLAAEDALGSVVVGDINQAVHNGKVRTIQFISGSNLQSSGSADLQWLTSSYQLGLNYGGDIGTEIQHFAPGVLPPGILIVADQTSSVNKGAPKVSLWYASDDASSHPAIETITFRGDWRGGAFSSDTTAMQQGDTLFEIVVEAGYGSGGYSNNKKVARIVFETDDTNGSTSDTSSPGNIKFKVTPAGTTTPADVLELKQDKEAKFSGRVTAAATVDITGSLSASNDITGSYIWGNASELTQIPRHLQIRLVGSGSAVTLGTGLTGDFRLPDPFAIKRVGAYTDTAGTGGVLALDINVSGSSILSTTISIDSTHKSSTSATSSAVISDGSVLANEVVTFDVDSIHTTASNGLTVWMDIVM